MRADTKKSSGKDRYLSYILGYEKVKPYDFYRDLFPVGSFERLGYQDDRKPNGVILSIDTDKNSKSKRKGTHTILTDGLEQLSSALEQSFVICSPISYFGRSRKATNASQLYALTLDIDYVAFENLEHLCNVRYDTSPGYGAIPVPTYTVNSGHGIHLYYVLEHPVPMYPDNQREILKLKKFLVDLIWDKYVSYKPECKECLGLVQGFRMVGSPSKIKGKKISAFKTGEKCTLNWLESFDRANRLQLNIKQSHGLDLRQAKELYPDWYERRIVNKTPAGIPNWRPKRDLYDWWKRKALIEIEYGHRYFGIMALAIFASKCGINYEELEKDALKLQKDFEYRGDKPFTVEDTYNALEAYNESYRTFPRKDLERLTAVSMPPNKRNGLSQQQHLEIARAIRDVKQKQRGTKWTDNNSRKGSPNKTHPKKDLILEYKKEHPTANNSEISRALGVSRTTVVKWLSGSK